MYFQQELLIAMQDASRIPFLKLRLNELVVPSPKLTYNGNFDQKLQKAIVEFKTQFNRKHLLNQLPVDGVINSELWKAIGIEMGEARINEEFNNLSRDPLLVRMLQGELEFGYTQAMKICDQKLAEIFGGEGAVVATIYDPKDLREADGSLYAVLIKPRHELHAAKPRNDVKGTHERGGIIHVYTNAQGLPADVGLYVPAGFERIHQTKDEKGKTVKLVPGAVDNTHYFYSGDKRLYTNFAHVKTEKVGGIGSKKPNGSVKIGNIGGPGGGTTAYIHSHLGFYSEFFGSPNTGTRVDPRDYFCK